MFDADRRPVNVLVGWREKQLFDLIDERLAVCRFGEVDCPPPDILVIPFERAEADLARAADAASREVWTRVAAGETLLVFDGSREGVRHSPRLADQMHAFLRGIGAPSAHAVMVTQDRGYAAAYGAYCAEAGLEPVHVANHDYYIRRFFLNLDPDGEQTFALRLAAFQRRPGRRARRFICLNFTPRPIKVMLLLRLMRDGLWDAGHVSFGGFAEPGARSAQTAAVVRERVRTMEGFEDIGNELAPFIDALDAAGRILVGKHRADPLNPAAAKPQTGDAWFDEYDDAWFTIVTETEVQGPLRITEKPFKSLVNFHPTIILGNPGALKLVRELGFRTFDGYMDESYDLEADPRRRFDAVYDEIRRLCALPEAELHRMERDITETLTFNALWGLTRLRGLYVDRLDAEMIDRFVRLIPSGATTPA